MIIHSFITIVSLFAYNFFTLFSSETSGIIFYASASHLPPDSIKVLVESSQPEGSSGKSIENLGNEAHNDDEMVPGVDSAKLPRYNYKTTEDLMSESGSGGKSIEKLENDAPNNENDMVMWVRSKKRKLYTYRRPKNLSSESEDELPYYRSRAQNKFKRPKNLRSESDFADWDRKVEHMKRRHLLLGRPISESALDGMPRLRPNHNEPYSGEMPDFYNYPHRVFKMLGSDIFFRFFKEKILTFSEIRGPDAKENEDDDITKMFKALGRLKIKFLDFKPLWNLISSDEGTFEHFVIKTTKILTDRWGYISIFQTSNVKNFLLSHPDLLEFHRLLICCDKNQWKKIEYRFLEAHLEERSKGGVVYQDAALKVLSSQVKDDFLKLKEPEEDRFKLPDEYNLDYDESKPFESFTKSVFVFHTVNYLRKHFIGASLEPKISDQISAFSGIFKMFQKALKVQMKIISPEYDNDFRLKDSNAMKLNIEHLRSMMQHHKPTEEPDSNFYLYNVYLDMKSSSIAVISNWVSKIRSAMEEFHDEYRKFTTDWHRTDGHTYLAHNHDHYKDYYKDYVKQIEVQKLRMKDNDRILETVELVYHSKPQKVE